MKRIKLLFIFCILSIYSCSTSDNEPKINYNEETNNLIQGGWIANSFKIDGMEMKDLPNVTVTMAYIKNGPSTGRYSWQFYGVFGFPVISLEDYEIVDNGKTFLRVLTGQKFDVEVKNGLLYLDGKIEGQRWQFICRR